MHTSVLNHFTAKSSLAFCTLLCAVMRVKPATSRCGSALRQMCHFQHHSSFQPLCGSQCVRVCRAAWPAEQDCVTTASGQVEPRGKPSDGMAADANGDGTGRSCLHHHYALVGDRYPTKGSSFEAGCGRPCGHFHDIWLR